MGRLWVTGETLVNHSQKKAGPLNIGGKGGSVEVPSKSSCHCRFTWVGDLCMRSSVEKPVLASESCHCEEGGGKEVVSGRWECVSLLPEHTPCKSSN